MRVNFIEALALAVESFKSLYYSFCHALVSLLRAAEDGEMLGLRNALVVVCMIQADADQLSGFYLLLLGGVLQDAVHFNLIKVWCSRIVNFNAHAANVAEGAVLLKRYFI